MKTFWLFTTILVALLMGLSFARVLEDNAQLQYSADLYTELQRSLYAYSSPPSLFGFLEPIAILATFLLPFVLREHLDAFWSVLFSLAALLMAFPLVHFWLVEPTSAALRSGVLPYDWEYLRARLALGHKMRFGLHVFAFLALVVPMLWDKQVEELPVEEEPDF